MRASGVELALILCMGTVTASNYSGNMKFYIKNPFPVGFFIVRLSPFGQLQTSEYLPAKSSDAYFDASLDMYFVQTNIVGIWQTSLKEEASDDMINQVRGEVIKALRDGKITCWKILQIRSGMTKVVVTLQQIDDATYGFMPNSPVQDSFGPEIVFQRWKQS